MSDVITSHFSIIFLQDGPLQVAHGVVTYNLQTYNPCKWPCKWVTRVVFPDKSSYWTLLISGRGHIVPEFCLFGCVITSYIMIQLSRFGGIVLCFPTIKHRSLKAFERFHSTLLKFGSATGFPWEPFKIQKNHAQASYSTRVSWVLTAWWDNHGSRETVVLRCALRIKPQEFQLRM